MQLVDRRALVVEFALGALPFAGAFDSVDDFILVARPPYGPEVPYRDLRAAMDAARTAGFADPGDGYPPEPPSVRH